MEYLWADGHYDRLPLLAAALVQRRVAVIATVGGNEAAGGAKAAAATTPIIFSTDGDPVRFGLLANYPDIKVEIVIDYGLTDIVAGRYHAGVRWGE